VPTSPPLVAVLGAGAAGLLAAIHAAGSGARVLLLERTPDGGRKILISGGGRCNVLPSHLDTSRYVTASSPNSLRMILRGWSLEDQRAFFEEEVGIRLALEEESGKLFPVTNSARSVRDGLVRLAQARGVEWLPSSEVTTLDPMDAGWGITLAGGRQLRVDRVIVATGGLSVPKTGSDGFAYDALARLGHTIHPTYPALTPLTVEPASYADLAGVSLPVTMTARGGTERREASGGFLFTHRGYSGPAVLDVSHVAVRARLAGETPPALAVQWTSYDAETWEAFLAPAIHQVGTVVRRELPSRLADRLMADCGIDPTKKLSQLTRVGRKALVQALTNFPLPWTADEGYKKAEVTGGGVALGEVQPATMESRIHPGLFLAGELLDAFGPIGGYNFVWAWVTGRLAGLGASMIDDR
jgi:predicted Rossmann fold flavoprotein